MTDNDTTPTEQRETDDIESTVEPANSVDETDVESVGLERRKYLQSVGIAGAISGLGLGAGAAGSAAAQQSWEDEADERIQEHRTGELEVVVQNENGAAVSGADVSIEQQEHEFGFGTAVHAEFLTRGSEWGDDIHTEEDRQNYREAIEEYFNTVVLENLHKWYLWEDNQQIADEAVEWALERDMDIRGHVCLWGNIEAWAIPPDVVEAMGEDWADHADEVPDEFDQPDYDPDYVYQESMNHIEEIITYYGDDITEWEVVNEVFHEPAMIEAIEGDGVDPTTADILGEWYEEAEQIADQYGIDIAVNDYNTLNGNHNNDRQQYHDQIDYLVNDRGVDLDGIGMQSHHYPDERISYDEMMNRLDEYAQYGAGLRITEFDMFGSGWDRQMQADYLHRFLKTFFSHPEAEDFLMWGIWDPLHWGDELDRGTKDAPLYEDDWTEKPAFDEYVGLVFDEWWTDESGTTDSSGTYTTDAFLGEHEITVSVEGQTETETISVTDSDEGAQVTVTVQGVDGSDGIVIDGNEVQDSTGDGYYNDFDGDGDTTHDDVTTFFENLEDDAIQNNADSFDFDENGRIGFGDVIDLLGDV